MTDSDRTTTNAELDDLRYQLAKHLQLLLEHVDGNEFLDLDFARSLHRKLGLIFDRWSQLTEGERLDVADAVHYLVHTDDEEHDLHSPIGLVDDGEKVDALLRRIAPDLLS